MNNIDKLKGERLAKAYAAQHPLAKENPGKIWVHYNGGGWITLRGDGLRPHPDMAEKYPNGWSMAQKTRSSSVRQFLAKLTP